MLYLIAYQLIPVSLFVLACFARKNTRAFRRLTLAGIAFEAFIVCASPFVFGYILWLTAAILDSVWPSKKMGDVIDIPRAKWAKRRFVLLASIGALSALMFWTNIVAFWVGYFI